MIILDNHILCQPKLKSLPKPSTMASETNSSSYQYNLDAMYYSTHGTYRQTIQHNTAATTVAGCVTAQESVVVAFSLKIRSCLHLSVFPDRFWYNMMTSMNE